MRKLLALPLAADLGFVRNDRGVWRRPMDDATKSRLFGGAS